MKKRVFLLVAVFAAGMMTMVNGQNLIDGNKSTDNWAVGVNVGAITPLNHGGMRPNVGVELDKQLTPVFGLGLEGMFNVNTTPSRNAFDQHNISVLGKVNLNNWFGHYLGHPRVFELELVAGIGWGHDYNHGLENETEGKISGYEGTTDYDKNYVTSKFGLNFNFNVGERKAWTIAIKPAFVYNLRDGEHIRYNINNGALELTAGFVYHFKNSNGKHYMTWAKAYDQAEIDALNAKINDLRGTVEEKDNQLDGAGRRIKELEDELEDCRNQEPVEVVQTVTETSHQYEVTVTFGQGKTTIDASQQPNVERIATYMKNHGEVKAVIKGYASPEGSAEVNERIANQRAEAVKTMLVNKYKIAANRIEAEGLGVGDVFEEPDWNRVSICTLVKE